MNERKLSELQKEYRVYFLEKMKLYGVKSPAELIKDKKSEFFTEVKQDWAKHKLAKNKINQVVDQKVQKLVEDPAEVHGKYEIENITTSPESRTTEQESKAQQQPVIKETPRHVEERSRIYKTNN